MTKTLVLGMLALVAAGCARETKTSDGKASPLGGVKTVEAKERVLVESVVVPEVDVVPARPTRVHVAWSISKGTGVNEEGPFRVRWTTSEGLADAPADVKGKGGDARDGFDLVVTPTAGVSRAHLVGRIDVVVCDVETHKVCLPVTRKIDMSFHVVEAAAAKAEVFVPLPEARSLN